jgi:hypothetical protein
VKKKTPRGGPPARTIWHPAFLQALKLEFSQYNNFLEYLAEYQLTAEPLRIDVVVIKKPEGLVIEKNIGVIFRAENIIEYKSPGDYVSVWDFYKVYGYACLYAAINQVPVTGLSLTFAGSHYPKELASHLEGTRGFKVEKTAQGIYTVTGDIMPIQIIDNRQLSAEENLWLKDLDDRLGAEDIRRITAAIARLGKVGQIRAYLEVITKANAQSVREALKMSDTTLTLEKVFEEAGLTARWEAKGKKEGETKGEKKGKVLAQKEMARKALLRGLPEKTIVAITGLKVSVIRELAAGNKRNGNGLVKKNAGGRKSAAKRISRPARPGER